MAESLWIFFHAATPRRDAFWSETLVSNASDEAEDVVDAVVVAQLQDEGRYEMVDKD